MRKYRRKGVLIKIYFLSTKSDKQAENSTKSAEFNGPIDIYNCTREQFNEILHRRNVKPSDYDFAWDAIRLKLPYRELAVKYGYELEGIGTKKRRIKEKIM